jgi:glycosyltransferase involved in cell wall biosynthesis
MKVLVYPHTMVLSGVLNAIELAAAVRDRGHEVIVLSRQGPLVEVVRELGLEHVLLDPRARRLPSPRAAAQLTRLVKDREIDVVNAWEWPSAVEAFAGVRLGAGIPVVCTVFSMSVAKFMPHTLPLIVGSEEIAEQAVDAGYGSVTLIEPPVDVLANAPGYDSDSFRSEFGLDAAPLLVVVCRLAHELKLEGLLAACDVVGNLAQAGVKVNLAVVGDGPARQEVEAAAAAANVRAGRRAVILTGALYDPRSAYAAADVVLGMGGSALRGMAFAKPLVVQGERGYWQLATPDSVPTFLRQGWYGIGSDEDGRVAGAQRLEKILRELLDDTAIQHRLGQYGRELVVERFSLDRAGGVLEEVLTSAIERSNQPSSIRLAADVAHTGIGVLRHQGLRKWRRWRGKPVARDDSNAVARTRSRGAQ